MSHIQRILVAIDASPCSIAALTHATALAEDLGAAVDVLRVQEPEGAARGPAFEQAEREIDAALGRAASDLGERFSRRVESGDPLRRILETAASGRYDLIVMGTHGRVGRLHALIGSVAEGVVRNAHCPVLTVREPGGEAESFKEQRHGSQSLAEQIRS